MGSFSFRVGVKPVPFALRFGWSQKDISTKVRFSLASFLHSQSSVGIFTDTFPGVTVLGPAKGLSSEVEAVLSISGM